MKKDLIYFIGCFRSRGYQVCTINQMTIKTFSNMTCGDYLKQPMQAVERRIIMNIDKNLQLKN